MTDNFFERSSVQQVEEGTELAPKFDADGLIPVTTTDYNSGEVLMQAYMIREALLLTIESGEAHYWSRSRRCLWHKGETSGLLQVVKQLLIDDDQDSLWMRVELIGGASCHVGYRSCFYREVPLKKYGNKKIKLLFTEDEKVLDPKSVYDDAPNPTRL